MNINHEQLYEIIIFLWRKTDKGARFARPIQRDRFIWSQTRYFGERSEPMGGS